MPQMHRHHRLPRRKVWRIITKKDIHEKEDKSAWVKERVMRLEKEAQKNAAKQKRAEANPEKSPEKEDKIQETEDDRLHREAQAMGGEATGVHVLRVGLGGDGAGLREGGVRQVPAHARICL